MRATTFILICLFLQTACNSTRSIETTGSEEIEQLRQRHKQARATFAESQDYGKDYRASVDSGHDLISALLNHWVALPMGSAEAPLVKKEIWTLVKGSAKPLTERHNIEKSFLARAVWPLLAQNSPRPEQATFFAELTKPQLGVRINDRIARAGRPTEPLGWDVQAAHALALIRSGKNKEARDEITILHDKVAINHARNPNGKLDYGPEAGAGRYRNYTDYLQLCEVLRALQAAILDDHKGARAHIENARSLREALSTEATPLVAEVARRVDANQD